MQPEWRHDLSFSDRFGTISEIAGALQKARISQSSQAREQAREIETAAYEEAATLADYRVRCQAAAGLHESTCDDVEADSSDSSDSHYHQAESQVIGKYERAYHHSDGRFSTVYRALKPNTIGNERHSVNNMVALKLTTPVTEMPHDAKREARILSSLQHRSIISLLETFSVAGGCFVIAFPFMPCEVNQMLRKQMLTPKDSRNHLRDLFAGLQHLHASGIIHRDVKPSNILLKSPRGPAYLADFGIAWSPTDPGSEAADDKVTDVGTTAYRPPELLFGHKSYGKELDIWAAGCVAAELVSLSNTSLFEAGDLGTELALIRSIFSSLGTPDLCVWPEAANFPDWGKMQWKEYRPRPWSELLPGATLEARDLVSKLVVYESARRLDATNAIKHPYFDG